jgi:hypothetical protein
MNRNYGWSAVAIVIVAMMLFWLHGYRDEPQDVAASKLSRSARVDDSSADTAERSRSARLKSSGRLVPEGAITTHTPEQLKHFVLIECSGRQVSIRTALRILDEAYKDACYFSLEKPLKLSYTAEGADDSLISFSLKGEKFTAALDFLAALAGMEAEIVGTKITLTPMADADRSTDILFSLTNSQRETLWQNLIDRGECDPLAERPDIGTLLRLNGLIQGGSVQEGSLSIRYGTRREQKAIAAFMATESTAHSSHLISTKLITSKSPLDVPLGNLDNVELAKFLLDQSQKESSTIIASPTVSARNGQLATVEIGDGQGENWSGLRLTYEAENIGLKMSAHNETIIRAGDGSGTEQRSESQFLVYAGDSQMKEIGHDAEGYHYQLTSISPPEIRQNDAGADQFSNPPVATAAPGKSGFVFSPYNNNVVDVRDIPSGTLVADPHYPASEKKYFRVP